MKWREHIESKPEILFGKPVIKGTRIPVDLILEKLSLGINEHDLLNSYPRLTKENILACLAFAAESIKNQRIYPIAS